MEAKRINDEVAIDDLFNDYQFIYNVEYAYGELSDDFEDNYKELEKIFECKEKE